MSSRSTPANGVSGDSKPGPTVKAKSGQRAQPQSTTPGNALAKPTLKQGQTSGRPAPSTPNTAGTPSKSNTTGATSKPNTAGTPSKSNTTGAPGKPNTAGTSGKSNTESTTSTPVKHHNTWVPRERIDELNKEGKERVAKLSAEENNGAHREPSVQDALNKFRTAVKAEGNAQKAYMEEQTAIDNDKYRSGMDYYRGGMRAGPLGTTWEQAAHSAALAYNAFKKAAGQ